MAAKTIPKKLIPPLEPPLLLLRVLILDSPFCFVLLFFLLAEVNVQFGPSAINFVLILNSKKSILRIGKIEGVVQNIITTQDGLDFHPKGAVIYNAKNTAHFKITKVNSWFGLDMNYKTSHDLLLFESLQKI
jgi:hypothetical protein